MKSFLTRTAFALTAATLITAAGTSGAKAETFWVPIENWSSWEVVYDVRISGEDDGTWGDSDLYDVLMPDYSTDLRINVWDSCYVDIKIETDWTTHEVFGVNICDTAAIVVGDGEAWVEYYDDYYYGD